VTIELYCPEGKRRELVRASTLNGIDFLEVLSSHRTLLVHCLRPNVPELDERHVVIEGGVRVTGIEVEWAARADNVDGLRRLLDLHPAARRHAGEPRGAAPWVRRAARLGRVLVQG
jgi:hypothetical protein